MNHFRKLLFSVAVLTLTFLITRCSEEEAVPLPELPSFTADVSSLSLTRGETTTFQVTIAAPGKFKEIDVRIDKGTVALSNIVGVGRETATATITYTAATDPGTASILIKIIDNSSQDVSTNIAVTVDQAPPVDIEAGEVEGEWGPYLTMNVNGNVTIPAGKSLTILEGTTIVMNGDFSITAEGNFYCMGSEKYPNKFTVASPPKKSAEIFNNVWGGIIGTSNSTEMVAVNTKFSYTSGPALVFDNPAGTFIMQDDTVEYTTGHGVQLSQGTVFVYSCNFFYNGLSGGDAVNIDDGATGEVVYNLIIGAATNGVRSSNSKVNIYNNSVLESGWRQTEEGLGGSFTIENGAKGFVYNNMVVNSRYGLLLPVEPNNPEMDSIKFGYSYYYGNTDESVAGFYPANGSLSKDTEALHDIAGGKGENDPLFTQWDGLTTFDNTSPIIFLPKYYLKLQAASPAIGKSFTAITKNFDSHMINGVTYTVPGASTSLGAN